MIIRSSSLGDLEFSELIPGMVFGQFPYKFKNEIWRKWLKVKMAVYLIYYNETLDWVGQSTQGVANRLNDHFRTPLMRRWEVRYSVAILPTRTEQETDDIEDALIKELHPTFNNMKFEDWPFYHEEDK